MLTKPPHAQIRKIPDIYSHDQTWWQRFKLATMRVIMRRFGVPHEATDLFRSAMILGNPSETAWPSETIPMNSKLFASGFWNYSFFQFNRKFYPPFWAEKQYNPKSRSFLPRSHNILSMNQTQRNWVAIGFPGRDTEASVDMSGALMPYPGAYTVEFATIEDDKLIRPQNEPNSVFIKLVSSYQLKIEWRGFTFFYEATTDGIRFTAEGNHPLIVSVRPFNFEGPALLYDLTYSKSSQELGGDAVLKMVSEPDLVLLSNLQKGDALRRIATSIRKNNFATEKNLRTKDRTGIATAAIYFSHADDCEIAIQDKNEKPLPLPLQNKTAKNITKLYFDASLEIEMHGEFQKWYEHAKNHLIALWDYDAIKPGSYTYHHFWIRDAVVMLYALLLTGAEKAVRPTLETFSEMISRNGLFKSQTGEWDANGQALWILGKYTQVTHDTSLIESQKKHIAKNILWIHETRKKHGGVLPPGFSAEHLGPADWYLWDNFWALAGLESMEPYETLFNLPFSIQSEREELAKSLNHLLDAYSYLPAALGRGKDAGMIGSISAAHPLQIAAFSDQRLLNTIQLIEENYFYKGCFFQENIHSGMNPYLTLQMAQSYLYFGYTRKCREITKSVLKKAQKAYTFPEAINVTTGGGCMGDGFHGWASAEAILLIRNMLVREAPIAAFNSQMLIFLSGFSKRWLASDFSAKNLITTSGRLKLTMLSGRLSIRGFNEIADVIISLPENISLENSPDTQKLLPEQINPTLSKERNYYRITSLSNEIAVQLSFFPKAH